jgi:hypothetical protein
MLAAVLGKQKMIIRSASSPQSGPGAGVDMKHPAAGTTTPAPVVDDGAAAADGVSEAGYRRCSSGGGDYGHADHGAAIAVAQGTRWRSPLQL